MSNNNENVKLTAREIAAAFDTNAGPTVPAILTVEEAAALLRVPIKTIYDWSSRGLLKGCCRKVGKHLRFFRDRLLLKVFNEGLSCTWNLSNHATNPKLIGDVVRIFLKGPTWWANCQVNGRQRRRSLRTTSKKEARRRALLLEADILRGTLPNEGHAGSVASTIEAYRSYLKAENRASKTLVKYNGVLNRVHETGRISEGQDDGRHRLEIRRRLPQAKDRG